MSTDLTELFGPVIHSYSRRQAIEDGVLVQLSGPGYEGDKWVPEMVAEVGIRVPVAITAAAFGKYVALSPAAERAGNDIKGRLWDVLYMFAHSARGARNKSQFVYEFRCVTDRITPSRAFLKAVIGPGDDPEPVLTLMLREED